MAPYVQRVREATKLLQHFVITHIPQSENRQADAVSKLASLFDDGKSKNIQWETLTERSINPHEVLSLERSSTWMDPIRVYLTDDTLHADSKEADRVKWRSNWFILYEGILYKKSFVGTPLRGITLEDGKRILEDLPKGIYSAYTAG